MNASSYLRQQGRKYYARFQVPADVRHAFGKGEVWINLGTEDRRLAETRVQREASRFRAQVLEARGKDDSVEQDALDWRREIDRSDDLVSEIATLAIKKASEKYVNGGYKRVVRDAHRFHDGHEDEALAELGGPKAKTFVDIALLGKKPLLPFVAPWIAIRKTEVEPKTAKMDETAVRRFVTRFPLLHGVTRAAVAAWVEDRKTEVSAASVQREVTGIRAFWSYLRSREEISADAPDPFADLRYKEKKKGAAKAKRQRFTPQELSALYKAARTAKDEELADLIALAAYTGARREELAALKIEDAKGGWITIHEGQAKTEAGGRDVPVHPKIAPIIRRLRGKRTAGYLFADLDQDKYGKRGDALGKRFSRLKTTLGHPATKTFHSIRHTVVNMLEGAGVTENLAADIVGHKKTTMSYGLYSGRGATRPLLPKAVRYLHYPPPL